MNDVDERARAKAHELVKPGEPWGAGGIETLLQALQAAFATYERDLAEAVERRDQWANDVTHYARVALVESFAAAARPDKPTHWSESIAFLSNNDAAIAEFRAAPPVAGAR